MKQRISDLGERGLIRSLRESFPKLSYIGDDSAVLSAIECPVVTTDSFFEGTHFHRWWASPCILGRRLLEAALSDIAAMGASADWFLAALSLDPDLELDWIEDFYRGMTENDGIILAGGETVRGKRLGITLTVIGEGGDPDTLLRRSSLIPGDRLWVSGLIGRALDAPSMLEKAGGLHGSDMTAKSNLLSDAEVDQLRAFLQPRAEIELGTEIRKMGVRCAIDISDGLLSEAEHLARESDVNVILDINESMFFDSVKDRPIAAAAAGEDFILLFGASHRLDFSSMGCSLVGRAETGNGEVSVFLDGKRVNISTKGYDHLEV